MGKRTPKLRTVNKFDPPFSLNDFGTNFPYLLGREIVYLLASKGRATLEGSEWEKIFATCIGAEWKPSNVGLDDVVMGNTAWEAKTVKAKSPGQQKKIRLISGRNSIVYSYGERVDTDGDPNIAGPLVLDIWNERVSSVRQKFKHLRTVVLIKSADLSEVAVFEFDTIRYDPELYYWGWNKNNNLEGHTRSTNQHLFTWQPHGSQFTIIEQVPDNRLIIRIKQPPALDKPKILQAIGFNESWITVQREIK